MFDFFIARNAFEELYDSFSARCYSEGDSIFKAGDEVEYLYVFLTGQVRLESNKTFACDYSSLDQLGKMNTHKKRELEKTFKLEYHRVIDSPYVYTKIWPFTMNNNQSHYSTGIISSGPCIVLSLSRKKLRSFIRTKSAKVATTLEEMFRAEELKDEEIFKLRWKERLNEIFPPEPNLQIGLSNEQRKRFREMVLDVDETMLGNYNQESDTYLFVKHGSHSKLAANEIDKSYEQHIDFMKKYRKNLKVKVKPNKTVISSTRLKIDHMNRAKVEKDIEKRKKQALQIKLKMLNFRTIDLQSPVLLLGRKDSRNSSIPVTPQQRLSHRVNTSNRHITASPKTPRLTKQSNFKKAFSSYNLDARSGPPLKEQSPSKYNRCYLDDLTKDNTLFNFRKRARVHNHIDGNVYFQELMNSLDGFGKKVQQELLALGNHGRDEELPHNDKLKINKSKNKQRLLKLTRFAGEKDIKSTRKVTKDSSSPMRFDRSLFSIRSIKTAKTMFDPDSR